MSMISEQVNMLRGVAAAYKHNGLSPILREAADTIESLAAKLQAANMERSAECREWIPCNTKSLPDKEVLCCDDRGEMIIGYIFEDKTSETGFSAANNHDYMYDCIKWMEKPRP